jgi:hypothetical protein
MKLRLSESKIELKLFILFAVIITLILLFASCGIVNRLESSHNHFYYDTKALIVISRNYDSTKLVCKSPAGVKFYQVTDSWHRIKSDTIVLIENDWVYGNVKFLKHE